MNDMKSHTEWLIYLLCVLQQPVDEGPVFAMCMTGKRDQATLNQWISGLQQNNPILGQVPTLFRLEAGPKEMQQVANTESGDQHSSEPEREPEEEPKEPLEEEPQRNQRIKQ